MVYIWSLRWMYPLFLFLFVSCFYVLTNMVLGFFSKMTWQRWAFAHKHCTFNGFVVLFKNLQIRVDRLFEKQFIVCNFKVTKCVAPCRLMSRLGEVVAHGGSTVSQIPLQGFPSPVYPALHEHLYEPTVFWQTELTSQEWEPVVHSSKSKK